MPFVPVTLTCFPSALGSVVVLSRLALLGRRAPELLLRATCGSPWQADLPMKNGDFPIKNGDLPIKNGDLPMKNGDFPQFCKRLPEDNDG